MGLYFRMTALQLGVDVTGQHCVIMCDVNQRPVFPLSIGPAGWHQLPPNSLCHCLSFVLADAEELVWEKFLFNFFYQSQQCFDMALCELFQA